MRYRFGDCSLDVDRRELRRYNVLRPVEPQVFDLLEYLISNHERVVTRDDLFKSVWKGRTVSDGILDTRLTAARQAIGDNGAEQRLIRTIRGRGFRFIAAVDEESKADFRPQQISADSLLPDQPAIAVLPFVGIGAEHDALAESLAEEIVTALSKSDWLFAVSRNSSFFYKAGAIESREIARRFGTRYLLEGSVRRLDDRVRVTVRLIDGCVDHQLWAERYDCDSRDITRHGDEFVTQVTTAVVAKVYHAEHIHIGSRRSGTPTDWERTVRALSLMNSRAKPQVAAAKELVRSATQLEPRSAKFYSLLSFITTLGVQLGWERGQTALPAASHAADLALAIDLEEPWAHAALGFSLIWTDPERALRSLEQALALNPGFAVGHFLFALASTRSGWPEGVLERAELASRLSPLDLLARGNVGIYNNVRASASFVAGRYREGAAFARKAIAESPRLTPAYRQLVVNCALSDNVEEARGALKSLRRLVPETSLQWIKDELPYSRVADQRQYVEAFRIAGLG